MNPTTTPVLTRFRVQTVPPLEPLKVWHTISTESGLQCIGDLTHNIVLALGIDSEVQLELDGFALLPTSPVGAVRDGDVITVRCKPQVEKRKALEAPKTQDKPQKRRKTQSPLPPPPVSQPAVASAAPKAPTPATSSSTASRPPVNPSVAKTSDSSDTTSSDSDSDSSDTTSDGSESESESSSDSSSESSTDSDSNSDSESDSDSDGAPTPQPITRQPPPTTLVKSTKPQQQTVQTPPPRPDQPPVPPGQGKQSTKDRNARRRLLKKHQAAGTALVPPAPNPVGAPSSRVSTPAGARTSTPASTHGPTLDENTPATTTQIKPPAAIAPAKHANKNKRKGFDKDMADVVATRITYGSPDPVQPRATTSSQPTEKTKSRYTHYHVVPPSQRTDLPSNVIVTSVDVEAMDGMEGVGEWFDGEAREVEEDDGGADQQDQTRGDPVPSGTKIDWDIVDAEWEKSWDSFAIVGGDGWKSLKPRTLLGWKALTIDPSTCTPCTKIHLARVTASPDLTSKQVECFVVDRPGAGGIGFGFGGRYTEEAGEGGDEAEEGGETRIVEATEIESWKVVGPAAVQVSSK